jgi:hypothetical protein
LALVDDIRSITNVLVVDDGDAKAAAHAANRYYSVHADARPR